MFDLSPQGLLRAGLRVVVLLLSLCVHEFAHAWSAWRLGDDTAARQGRLTLNPFAHADPIGTYVLPLIGAPIGWAKPVPFDPRLFRRDISMGLGTAIVKAAGPIANVVMAVVCAVVLGILERFAPALVEPHSAGLVMLLALIQTNIGLALFNLIPVHPLDGAGVVDYFVPRALRPIWESVSALGPILLIGVILLVSRVGFLTGTLESLVYRALWLSDLIAGA